jgi:hypothetical protein
MSEEYAMNLWKSLRPETDDRSRRCDYRLAQMDQILIIAVNLAVIHRRPQVNTNHGDRRTVAQTAVVLIRYLKWIINHRPFSEWFQPAEFGQSIFAPLKISFQSRSRLCIRLVWSQMVKRNRFRFAKQKNETESLSKSPGHTEERHKETTRPKNVCIQRVKKVLGPPSDSVTQ